MNKMFLLLFILIGTASASDCVFYTHVETSDQESYEFSRKLTKKLKREGFKNTNDVSKANIGFVIRNLSGVALKSIPAPFGTWETLVRFTRFDVAIYQNGDLVSDIENNQKVTPELIENIIIKTNCNTKM